MGLQGPQDFWLAGNRVMIQRKPVSGTVQPWLDLGVITEVSPQVSSESVQLYDPDGGGRKLVDSEQTQFDEAYDVTCANLNAKNRALLLNATGATDFTQAGTPLTSVVHYAYPGRILKLADSNGTLISNVASIASVTGPSATPTYTLDTDWEVVDLPRGLIRMIDGGAFAAAGNIEVTFTPTAISGERLVRPQTAVEAIEATVCVFMSRRGGARQSVRECECRITPSSMNLANGDYSDFVLNFQVINDLTSTTEPAGRMLDFIGDVPSKS